MSENEDVDMDSGSESELSASDTSYRKEGYDDYYNRNRRQKYSSELETSMDNPDLHISEGGS